MRFAILIFACAVSAFAGEDLTAQAKLDVLTVQKNYKEIKAQSSPTFQKFKDAIAKGDGDFDQISERYKSTLGKLVLLKIFRKRIDQYKAAVEAHNEAIDNAVDQTDAEANRQKRLADIEARKSFTATQAKVTDRNSYVVRRDGSIDLVQTQEASASVTDIRENAATAAARAQVQKEEIDSAADRTAAKLQAGKLNTLECSITLEQIQALEDNEQTKFKYLMDKQK